MDRSRKLLPEKGLQEGAECRVQGVQGAARSVRRSSGGKPLWVLLVVLVVATVAEPFDDGPSVTRAW
ncbi:MAG: hypothetical protein PVH40_06835 [Gemmatimonadales bacterium]|jgi:hypothetical protein